MRDLSLSISIFAGAVVVMLHYIRSTLFDIAEAITRLRQEMTRIDVEKTNRERLKRLGH